MTVEREGKGDQFWGRSGRRGWPRLVLTTNDKASHARRQTKGRPVLRRAPSRRYLITVYLCAHARGNYESDQRHSFGGPPSRRPPPPPPPLVDRRVLLGQLGAPRSSLRASVLPTTALIRSACPTPCQRLLTYSLTSPYLILGPTANDHDAFVRRRRLHPAWQPSSLPAGAKGATASDCFIDLN